MGATDEQKWLYSAISGLIFLALSQRATYKVVDRVLAPLVGPIASPSGCPTPTGLVVHAIVFTLLVRLLMARKPAGAQEH